MLDFDMELEKYTLIKCKHRFDKFEMLGQRSFSFKLGICDDLKIVNNKIVLKEMYRHATPADLAELSAEKTCAPATTKK